MRAEDQVRSALSPERALPKEIANMTRYYTTVFVSKYVTTYKWNIF
jgi:hypothetical protein